THFLPCDDSKNRKRQFSRTGSETLPTIGNVAKGYADPVALADGHAHLFDGGFMGRYGRPCSGGDDVALYQALRHNHSIGTALVVGYEGDPRYRGNSRFIAKLAKLHGWIAPLAYVP